MSVPDEAVEAAAKAFYGTAWDDVMDHGPQWAMSQMRSALEAAAPFIAAQALKDAAEAFEDLPQGRKGSIASGTWEWFELFPLDHIRWRADDIEKSAQ